MISKVKRGAKEMPQLKNKETETFTVRRAKLNTSTDPRDWSPLGRKLMKIAAEIEASDEPGLSEDDIERRLKMGRGGYSGDDE